MLKGETVVAAGPEQILRRQLPDPAALDQEAICARGPEQRLRHNQQATAAAQSEITGVRVHSQTEATSDRPRPIAQGSPLPHLLPGRFVSVFGQGVPGERCIHG